MKRWYLKSRHIFDSQSLSTFAGVITIENDKISAISQNYQHEFAEDEIVQDYGDYMVIPGFIDTHQHIYLAALVFANKLHYVIDSTPVAIADKVSQFSTINGWKLAFGFYTSDFGEDILPTAADLDKVCPDIPTMVIAGDAHSIWLNSAAMKEIQVSKFDQEKYGGHAVKLCDAYSGFFEEGIAIAILASILNKVCPPTKELYLKYMHSLNLMGITGVADLALSGSAPDDLLYADIYRLITDDVKMRVGLFPAMHHDFVHIHEFTNSFSQGTSIRFAGVKQFYDGVTSTQTAYLKKSYPNSDFAGAPLLPNSELQELILQANAHNWPIRVHAIGDQAVWWTVLAFSKAQHVAPLSDGKYNTIEHLELIDPHDLPILGQTKAILSVQPSHALIGYDTLSTEVGYERAKNMFLFKDFLDAGAHLAFGTDAPIVVNNSPIQSLFYATTRRTLANRDQESFMPEQAISIAQALLAHTKWAAKAIGRNDIGEIKCGQLADMVVLSKNILDVNPERLLEVEVRATIVGGDFVSD